MSTDLIKNLENDIKAINEIPIVAEMLDTLTHGDAASAVVVSAKCLGDELVLTVSNAGKPIPAKMMAKLFHPFVRDLGGRDKDGLGLGLYISSEIAKAHGGVIDVQSDENATVFAFRMPLV